MFYDRKIKYLEDRVNGERISAAGFVKAELRGELCRIEIHVAGIRRTDTFEKPVFVLGGQKEGPLCKIKITEGRGDTGELCFHGGQLGESGIAYEDMEEIKIPLAAGRELRCVWREQASGRKGQVEKRNEAALPEAQNAAQSVVQSAETLSTVSNNLPKPDEAATLQQPQGPIQNAVQGAEISSSASNDLQNHAQTEESEKVHSTVLSTMQSTETSSSPLNEQKSSAQTAGLPEAQNATPSAVQQSLRQPLENKWEQLFAIYPHIAPFQDEREYISLGPEDFVIFPARYYRLVNNSFLLHGYHNYNHLILTRIVHRGEVRYYIGVPGNYYEKEKQVAIMFGFESFECKTEPVKQGDYGYYMMRIEL